MAGCLVVIIIIGLVGLGLAVCGIIGYFAWQIVTPTLIALIIAVIVGLFIRVVYKKIREQQGWGKLKK